MPRLTLAAAAFAAAAAVATTLAHARPALASDPPALSTGDDASLACGGGHTYVCYWTSTYTCIAWSYPYGSAVCTQYAVIVRAVYRD